MTVKVKICGISTREAIEAAQNNGASLLGFVFCKKSVRNITPAQAAELAKYTKIPKVAVTVDADDNLLDEIIKNLNPEYIQLHGNETDERAAEIKKKYNIKLIRAINPHPAPDAGSKIPHQVRDVYSFLLFDSPGGGTGKQFDYTSFKAPAQPWFLSGGLNASNIAEAVKQTGAKFIDVSSGVESTRGVKDTNLIKEFLQATKVI
jgi:phosphoribosylanthranilate isomerase